MRHRAMIWPCTVGIVGVLCVAGQAAAQTPAPVVAAAPATKESANEHADMVGHFGLGFYGISQVPLAATQVMIDAPVIGARYWLMDLLGFDFGVGYASAGGSTTAQPVNGASTTVNKQGAWAFLIHAGVPLSIHSAKHYSFQIAPEINFGLSHQTIKYPTPTYPAGTPDQKNSGNRFDFGVRAGAEIHFGFIGIPELTLQGSIGAFLTRQAGTTEDAAGKTSDTTVAFATTAYHNPWDLFMGNVAARYYF